MMMSKGAESLRSNKVARGSSIYSGFVEVEFIFEIHFFSVCKI